MHMLFDDIAPHLAGISDHQQRIIRYLYDERYTRPYVAAMLGISVQQVLIEEVTALRVVIEIMAKPKTKPPNKKKNPPLKMNRSGAGPSGL